MPFPDSVREEALVRSRRSCCVCRQQCGRNIEVHHIEPEASGGANTLDNAIALCFDCHADAGHYNPSHPRGTKFSPRELRRHRDAWWAALQTEAAATASLRDGTEAMPPPDVGFGVVEREVGTLWSRLANEPESREVIRFRGAVLGGYRQEGACFNSDEWELFLVRGGRYLVYHKRIERGDWCWANLCGRWGESDCPLSLTELQAEYPELATSAGLERIRVLEV